MNPSAAAIRALLLTAIRSEEQAALQSALSAIQPADWAEVLRQGKRHRITALLYRRLKDCPARVPAQSMAILREAYLTTAEINTRRYHYMAKILQALSAAGIPTIPLKGTFLAQNIYDNIAVRPMDDMDILVRRSDLPAARQIMEGLGFLPQATQVKYLDTVHHISYNHPAYKMVVELHWDLLERSYNIRVGLDEIWAQAHPALLDGIPIYMMGPEDQILHLSLHAAKEVFFKGLLPLCDVDATIRHYQDQLDWNLLSQHARLWGTRRCTYVTMRLASELLNAPVPSGWLASQRDRNFDEHVIDLLKERIFAEEQDEDDDVGDELVHFLTEKRNLARLTLAWQRIFVSRQALEKMYPELDLRSWRLYLYYPVRIIHLLREYLWIIKPGAGRQMTGNTEKAWSERKRGLRAWLLGK